MRSDSFQNARAGPSAALILAELDDTVVKNARAAIVACLCEGAGGNQCRTTNQSCCRAKTGGFEKAATLFSF